MRMTIGPALAGVAVLALVGTTAWAHGPTRQKVRESIEINAPQAKVWEQQCQSLLHLPHGPPMAGSGRDGDGW